ncbi:hypothetical protein [Rhodococcus sp. BP22]|uniref:hypothetical protein n=1 Tax=Rhodococcus sp. BP22 TaxID=2758566 RepID=UPI001647A3CC|nr:hypothetical protein [Rhodococcus sp. BP22]
MTSPMPTRLVSWAGRVGSMLAVLSAVVHLFGLAGHGTAQTGIIAVMAVGCLYCAKHLWSRPRTRDWALVATMSIGMIAIHQNMSMPGGHAGHHGDGSATPSAISMPMPSAAILIACVEALFATTVLFATTSTTPLLLRQSTVRTPLMTAGTTRR